MILNDIWNQFNRLIQGNNGTDIGRKINALNVAHEYLIKRMIELAKGPDEFRSDPTNVANTISLNYVALPSDFLSLNNVWKRSGTQTIPIGKDAMITYDDLLIRAGESFFDSNVKGSPNLCAVKNPNIYFDTHFNNVFTKGEIITGGTSGATATITTVTSSTVLTIAVTSGTFSPGEIITGTTSGTTATITTVDSATQLTIVITGGTKEIKIDYWKQPAEIVAYDNLPMNTVVGTFEVGEVVEGGTSASTGTIYAVNALSLDILTDGRDGSFSDGETITGASSSATAVVDGSLSNKVQTLEWSDRYKLLLTEAWALMWFHMKGSNEVSDRSVIVDNLINTNSILDRQDETSTWSTN